MAGRLPGHIVTVIVTATVTLTVTLNMDANGQLTVTNLSRANNIFVTPLF